EPLENNRNKALRGFNNLDTAKLLVPAAFDISNPQILPLIRSRNENYLVTARQWPAFLYPHGHIYNPADIDEGLGYGYLLLRVMKHIFTTPSSALEGPGAKGKGGNAKLIGMTAVTPEAVAYTAVQTRYVLNSQSEWGIIDNDFNAETFFWNVVNAFKG
ncbi:hypothetical protein K474DRAFT_1577786, partial [Panus rudis PR-1116 ss-1]